MKITGIIWLQGIVDKLSKKHHVTKDEVKQVFFNEPQCMVNKKEHIPKNMTIEEASDFWDTHSVADYPSHIVQLEYKQDEQITFVAIANDLLLQLEKKAKKQGASIETLINLWIKEKLTA